MISLTSQHDLVVRRGALVLGCGAAVAGTVWLSSSYALTVLAVAICFVTAVPLLLQRGSIDLFSPWAYLFYFVLLNVLARSVLIDFELTGGHVDLNELYFLDQPREFLAYSMIVMLFGFCFLAAGYLLPKNRVVGLHLRVFRSTDFESRRTRHLVAVLILISLGAFVAFVQSTFEGGVEFTWRLLSSHRGVSAELPEYRAHGYLRLLVNLSTLAAYVAYVQMRNVTTKREYRFYRRALICALLVSLAMAFYTQSRAALVFALLNILFIKYYLDDRKFPWKPFLVIAPVVLAMFIATSALRVGAGVNLTDRISPMTIVAPVILTNGGIDASKTGHIVDYVDSTQDFRFGSTLLQVVWSIVPRELWPSKPPSLDTIIGEAIYGAQRYGSGAVPAGFFGEMYLNFWYAGIALGALLLGAAMKFFNNLLSGNRRNAKFILCYVVALQTLGMSVIASGFASTMIGILSTVIPLLLCLAFITPRQSRVHLHGR